MSENDAPATSGFGGFCVGELALAVPLESLREVVRCPHGLMPLPCVCEALAGGLEVRGVVVPVLDLRRLLGRPEADASVTQVLVLRHAGRLFGLQIDDVTGVFQAADDACTAMAGQGPSSCWMAAALMRPDTREAVSVLSVPALAALPGLILAEEREAADARGQDLAAQPVDWLHRLLVDSGGLRLSIDATAVHATLSALTVADSPLARGPCRGVIRHLGREVPAVDLAALLGLGADVGAPAKEAFLIESAGAWVAMLVDRVVDVRRVEPDRLLPLMASLLPGGDGVQGLLAVEDGECLDLCAAALAGHPAVQPLGQAAAAATKTFTGTPAGGAMGAQRAPTSVVLTFEAWGEAAVPLSAVVEILPYRLAALRFRGQGAALGAIAHRGRSLPLFCLSRLLGPAQQAVSYGAQACVLVVEYEGQSVGFVVQRLRGIEPTDGEAHLPARSLDGATSRWPLVRVSDESTGQQRLVRRLDLVAMAAGLRQAAAALPSGPAAPSVPLERAAVVELV